MGTAASKDAEEGIVTVTTGATAAAPSAAAVPQITSPQALDTLASLAELRKLVPEPEKEPGAREFVLLAAVTAESKELCEQLSTMVYDHQAWANSQANELLTTQRAIHTQIDQVEQKAAAALQHVARSAGSLQATERQLLQLGPLSQDLGNLVESAQAAQQRLHALRTRWQQQRQQQQ